MASYINNSVFGFLSCYRVNSSTYAEKIGDFLLSPLHSIFSRRCLEIFVDDIHPHGVEKSYNYALPDPEQSRCVSVIKKICQVVSLPIVVPGVLFKAVGLINSEMRHVYCNWTESLSVPESMDQIIASPKNYVACLDDLEWAGSLRYIKPFEECACTWSGHFDRTKNSRRSNLEKQMIDDVLRLHPNLDEPLLYMSVGSGGLLQEVINVGKLIKEGYKAIEVYLVDPETTPRLVEFFTRLMKTYATPRHCSLKVFCSDTITKHKERFPNKGMHIISAIDYEQFDEDQAARAVFTAHTTLAANGRMYLAWDIWNWTLNQRGTIQATNNAIPAKELIISEDPMVVRFTQDLQKSFPASLKLNTITCAWFGSGELRTFVPTVFQEGLSAQGIQHIHVRPIHDNHDKKAWSPEILEKYLSLCCQGAIQFTVEAPRKEEDYFGAVASGRVRDDMVVAFNVSAASEKDFHSKLKKFRDALPNSACYMNSGGAVWKFFHHQFTPLYYSSKECEEQIEKLMASLTIAPEKEEKKV